MNRLYLGFGSGMLLTFASFAHVTHDDSGKKLRQSLT